MSDVRKGCRVLIAEGPLRGTEGEVTKDPQRVYDPKSKTVGKRVTLQTDGGHTVQTRLTWVHVLSYPKEKSKP